MVGLRDNYLGYCNDFYGSSIAGNLTENLHQRGYARLTDDRLKRLSICRRKQEYERRVPVNSDLIQRVSSLIVPPHAHRWQLGQCASDLVPRLGVWAAGQKT